MQNAIIKQEIVQIFQMVNVVWKVIFIKFLIFEIQGFLEVVRGMDIIFQTFQMKNKPRDAKNIEFFRKVLKILQFLVMRSYAQPTIHLL